MKDIFRYEFTAEEMGDIVMGIISAKVEDEMFLKNYHADDDTEFTEKLKDNILRYNALLDKIRRDYK